MSDKHSKSPVIHSVQYNFIMNFILTASNFIFPLITFPYTSRVLKPEGNGQVDFAVSVANYFLMVASLGIPTYGVKACAKVRDDKEKLSRTAQEILIINLIATILVTITYIICIFTVPRFAEDKTLFFIEGINIVLNMFGANWLYQALEQYDYITVRSLVFKAVSVVLMFLLVHQQSDYHIYAATTVLAAVGSNVLNFIRLHHYISLRKTGTWHFRQHLKPIFILFAQSAAAAIYTNLDTVMLGFMRSKSDVGYYTTAVKVKNVLLAIVNSLGSVLLPRMSYYVNQHDQKNFRQLMVTALNAELFMALPLVTYFTVEARDTILFLAGSDYLPSVMVMQTVNIALIPIGLTTIIGIQTLTPLNREMQVLISVIVGAVSDFIMNLLMIPEWGAFGAALATTIAEFLVLLAQLIMGRDILKGTLKDLHILRYLTVSLIAAGVTLAFVYLIARVPGITTIMSLPFVTLLITAILFFGIYAAGLYMIKDEFVRKLKAQSIFQRWSSGRS